MSTAAATTQHAFRRCARLLQELHRLIAAGRDEGEEAEALRAEMDPLWYAMSEEERDRIRGLTEDLYVLAEGGAKQAPMSPEEKAGWSAEATTVLSGMFAGRDVDAALKFLRRPVPDDRPRYIIPFLQARCWDRLGEGEIALLFLKEAERVEPRHAVLVLNLLERLARTEEAMKYAERIIANPHSSGEELYQAAATLLRPARQMRPGEASPIFQRVIPILERSLTVLLTTPRGQREIQDADLYIIAMLGFSHAQLGNVKTAVQLYSDGLARYPGDVSLLTLRGLARIDADLPKALGDCRKAVQAGSVSMWPYYFLAWDALRQRNYPEVWQLCLLALQRSGGFEREQAQLYEWLAIALAESGQPLDWVVQNLQRAVEIDPSNERIRRNLATAKARRAASIPPGKDGWEIERYASSEQALRSAHQEDWPAPDLFVERADSSLAALLQ
jgi:tetratricopeptide (TPR) repeat protein